MTKLRNATLALAASLLATGALGQAFMQDSEVVTVAEELFGPGSDVELEFLPFEDDTFTPKAKLIFTGSATIAANTEFDVTYTLVNAKFARSASIYDIMWGTWGADLGDDATTGGTDDNEDDLTKLRFYEAATEASVTVKEGGAKGSSSVTYTFKVPTEIPSLATPTATDADSDPATPDTYDAAVTTRKIVFVMPELNASGLTAPTMTGPGKKVWVRTAVTQATRGGGGGTAIDRDLDTKTECGAYKPEDATTTVACPLVNVHKVLTGVSVSPGGGNISLAPADMRKKLVDGTGKALDPQRVRIATVSTSSDFGSEVMDAEGNVLTDFTGGALRGNLTVSVTSEGLRDGDVVYVDANDNKAADGTEPFERGAGTAADTLPLGGTYTVYYQPNGEDELKHRTTFTIGASSEFAVPSNKNRSAMAQKATLTLHGIMASTLKAYAIAPLTSTDESNVRVKCENDADAGCNVFLDCTDGMGESTFGEGGAMIAAGASVRWDQEDIATALGMMPGESWTGRLSCEVLSTAHVTVQVLTRTNGVLVNNTYVTSTEP